MPNLKLDLRFLIGLEQQGFQVLKFYKYLHNPNTPNEGGRRNNQEGAQLEFSANELKHLLNQVYTFYSSNAHPTEMLLKKNPFYKCFVTRIVGADALFLLLKSGSFN